ncbi:MAG TPA: AAA family ATPase [Actinomycetota bacterium]|nr:AAA family ATPase [Actinomycetota bacterium]
MKLLELEIIDTRGIRDLRLSPKGENLVVWGPNGSGKSAVIDAVDFLFTGRMRRLGGDGTGGITLGKHGPHVDAAPDHALVRGAVSLEGGTDPLELVRRLSTPANLEFDEARTAEATPYLEIAARGQNILTRREILRFVTSDPRTRGEQIQALLDLVGVDNIRKALTQARNRCNHAAADAVATLTESRSRLSSLIGVDKPEKEDVLNFTNDCRQTLGAEALVDPSIDSLKSHLTSPIGTSLPDGLNPQALSKTLSLLETHFSTASISRLGALEKQVNSLREEILSDRGQLSVLKKKDLLSRGLELLDESGLCPLCETEWDPTELRTKIQQRLDAALALEKSETSAKAVVNELRERVSTTIAALNDLRLLGDIPAAATAYETVSKVADTLRECITPLGKQVHEILLSEDSIEPSNIYNNADVSRAVTVLTKFVQRISTEVDQRVAAWDSLTRLEEVLNSVDNARKRVIETERAEHLADELVSAFAKSRDEVLQELYDAIKERFVDLYRAIHSPDEPTFTAALQPKGAGVDLNVDFYGRGTHPPHALHSEGHQDSMGLCLFLALLEGLTGGAPKVVLLDDVVMSVDADHRRALAKLLKSSFPDTQFIITTHDRTWSNQLRTEGVVTSANTVQFYGWNLETGPRVLYEGDLWNRIAESLEKEDVPGAAHRLRRGSEEYFQSVCDAIRAPVRFSLAGRHELGDFVPAAMSRYKELIKRGKKAANSWGSTDALTTLEELESTAKQVFARTNAEQWAINDNVHYNSWMNLEAAEFEPIVEAFQDLYAIFRCTSCGTWIRVATTAGTDTSVKCDCGGVAWNLVEK